jgi:hypothetical protein
VEASCSRAALSPAETPFPSWAEKLIGNAVEMSTAVWLTAGGEQV